MAFAVPSPNDSLILHSVDLDLGNFDALEAESFPDPCLYSCRLFAVKVARAAYRLEMDLIVDDLNKGQEKQCEGEEKREKECLYAV